MRNHLSLLISICLACAGFAEDAKPKAAPETTGSQVIETSLYRYEVAPYALLAHPDVAELAASGQILGKLSIIDSQKKYSSNLGFGEIISNRRAEREGEAVVMKNIAAKSPKFEFKDVETAQLAGENTAKEFAVKSKTPTSPNASLLDFAGFRACLDTERPVIKKILSRIDRDEGEWETYTDIKKGFPCNDFLGKYTLPTLSPLETYKFVSAMTVVDEGPAKLIYSSLLLLYHPLAPDVSRGFASWVLVNQTLQAFSPKHTAIGSMESLAERFFANTRVSSPTIEIAGEKAGDKVTIQAEDPRIAERSAIDAAQSFLNSVGI